MNGYVYKAEVAGKVYIGKTSNFKARVKTHLNHSFKQNKQTPICQALRTLSEEDAEKAFTIIETIEGANYEELEAKMCKRENYWMERYDSYFPNGYNVNTSVPQKKRNVSTQPPRESVMREVYCVETGERYKSMSDAARSVGVDVSAVYHCLKGVNNTAGGKHWRYADGEYHECLKHEGQKNRPSQSKPVMCKETGIVYPSVGEASRQTGIGWTNIAKCARGTAIQAGGFKWGFVVDGRPIFHERKNKVLQKVMCVETGEIFESIAACARSLGDRTPGTLQTTIECGCKHKGKTYIRVD